MRARTVQWVMATGMYPSGADNLWLWAIDGVPAVLWLRLLPHQRSA